jgi:hypothetical protein
LNARQSGHVGPAAYRAAISDTARNGFQPDVSHGLLWISFQEEPAPSDPQAAARACPTVRRVWVGQTLARIAYGWLCPGWQAPWAS